MQWNSSEIKSYLHILESIKVNGCIFARNFFLLLHAFDFLTVQELSSFSFMNYHLPIIGFNSEQIEFFAECPFMYLFLTWYCLFSFFFHLPCQHLEVSVSTLSHLIYLEIFFQSDRYGFNFILPIFWIPFVENDIFSLV